MRTISVAGAHARADVDPRGDVYELVIDSIELPRSYDQTRAFGFDLDGDTRQRVDNTIRGMLAYLKLGDLTGGITARILNDVTPRAAPRG